MSMDELSSVEPSGVAEAFNIARDEVGKDTEHLANRERHAHPVVAIRVACDEAPQLAKGNDRDGHGRADLHVGQV